MRYLIIFILFIHSTCFGQDPTYFTMGETDLEGIDIYNIVQDEENTYWIATDQGLFKHDGYTYTKVEHPKMKASSLFSFEKDSRGNIYCHNFSHQLFKISNGTLDLFFEIPEEDQHITYSIEIDQDDNVYILGKSILAISPEGKVLSTFNKTYFTRRFNQLNRFKDGSVFTYNDQYQRYLHQRSQTFVYKEVNVTNTPLDFNPTESQFRWVNHKGRFLAVDRTTLYAFELLTATNELRFIRKLNCNLENQVIRLFSVENQIWIAGQKYGVYAFDEAFNTLNNGQALFPNHFISDIYEDHEGNHLIGTFDRGILVIPNLNAFSFGDPNHPLVTRLIAGKNGDVYCGTANGDVYRIRDNQLVLLHKAEFEKIIEHMSFWGSRNALLVNSQDGVQLVDANGDYARNYYTGSIKDVVFLNKNYAITAQNEGAIGLDFDNGKIVKEHYFIHDRCYSIAYEKDVGNIYAGTASGLKVSDSTGKNTLIKYHGEVVFGNTLSWIDDQLLIGTKRHGLLFLKNKKILKQIRIDGQIIKIRIQDPYIFVYARSGFYVYTKHGELVQKLNRSNGLSSDKIVDFELMGERLIVANRNGVQTIGFNRLLESSQAISVRLDWMKVNGKNQFNPALDYNQRKIEFGFSVATLKHRDNLRYEVKLSGYEDQWRTLDYQDNSIVYNALPPGNYVFMVRSINGEVASETQSYSFSISSPFYLKWWFYLAVTLFVVSLVILFYRQRLQVQEKRARQQHELNVSKLTAIQSQMNPHFIFNSLNSIQDLVIQGDAENAYTYITKFANLVRSTLNNSDKEFIEFEQEIRLLELYLTLEKLRFREDFDFEIQTNGVDDILIPPMLIQPFVENALVHGLLHKEGHRQLRITFELNDFLTCIIEDNGIGRAKAKEIKERQKGNHESFAVKGIKKRLNILKESFGNSIGFHYHDITNNEDVIGTKVIVKLPVKRTL